MTLALDPARSDLLVDAELARFADLVPRDAPRARTIAGPERRRFVGHAGLAARGMNRGFGRRSSSSGTPGEPAAEIPPAVRLLLAAKSSRVPPLKAARMLVLNLPNPELLDGLLQHPATGPLLGRRLGPSPW